MKYILILVLLLSFIMSIAQIKPRLPIEPSGSSRYDHYEIYKYYTAMSHYFDSLADWRFSIGMAQKREGNIDSSLVSINMTLEYNKDAVGYNADAANHMCMAIRDEKEKQKMKMLLQQIYDKPVDSAYFKKLELETPRWESIRDGLYKELNELIDILKK